MKTNGLRSFIYKSILLILLSLYFLLVFGETGNTGNRYGSEKGAGFSITTAAVDTPLPKLLSFEGISSKKQVRLNWRFESTDGLDECILERADKHGEFKPVAYFFMTEDIHIPNLRFTDNVPKSRTYQYRLKLTGRNGDHAYTKALSFDFNGNSDQKHALDFPLVLQ